MPAIVIDKREKLPYEFDGAVFRTIHTGDYTLEGFEDRVSIERKSKADAYGSVSGKNRKREESKIARMGDLDYGAVVIESTVEDFLKPPPRTQMHPRSALQSWLAWGVKYKTPVLFGGQRRFCQALVYHLLRHWFRYQACPVPGGGE